MYRINQLILPIIFIFFTNCGFKVLDKTTLDKLKINEINTVGDKKINFLIKNKIIKLSDANSLGELINIDIDSKKNKNIKEKNKQNKITKYQIEVITNLEILFLNKNIKKEIIIFEEGYYNVSGNNNTNRERQKKLEINLSEKISDEIIKNIYKIINDS